MIPNKILTGAERFQLLETFVTIKGFNCPFIFDEDLGINEKFIGYMLCTRKYLKP